MGRRRPTFRCHGSHRGEQGLLNCVSGGEGGSTAICLTYPFLAARLPIGRCWVLCLSEVLCPGLMKQSLEAGRGTGAAVFLQWGARQAAPAGVMANTAMSGP